MKILFALLFRDVYIHKKCCVSLNRFVFGQHKEIKVTLVFYKCKFIELKTIRLSQKKSFSSF